MIPVVNWTKKATRREGKMRKDAPRAEVCWIFWKLKDCQYTEGYIGELILQE